MPNMSDHVKKFIFCYRTFNLATDFATLDLLRSCNHVQHQCHNIIQLLDEAEQNIAIYQWRADQLFADADGIGK